jgi:hypothetical protein
MASTEVACRAVNWVRLTQDGVQWRAVLNMAPKDSTKGGNFLAIRAAGSFPMNGRLRAAGQRECHATMVDGFNSRHFGMLARPDSCRNSFKAPGFLQSSRMRRGLSSRRGSKPGTGTTDTPCREDPGVEPKCLLRLRMHGAAS